MLHTFTVIDPNALTNTCVLVLTIFVALIILILIATQGPPDNTHGEG